MNKISFIHYLNTRALIFLYTIAFIGGYADAGSFLLLETFTGHVTGISVLSMIHLSNQD